MITILMERTRIKVIVMVFMICVILFFDSVIPKSRGIYKAGLALPPRSTDEP